MPVGAALLGLLLRLHGQSWDPQRRWRRPPARFFFSLDALMIGSFLSIIGVITTRHSLKLIVYYTEISLLCKEETEIIAMAEKAVSSGGIPELTGLLPVVPPGVRGQVITCTVISRWVVSSVLHCFQLPAADGSREACDPHTDPTSPITKCEDKKDPSHPCGTCAFRRWYLLSTDLREK